jgi:hypothetical protein
MAQTSVAAPRAVPSVTLADYRNVGLLFVAFIALLCCVPQLVEGAGLPPDPALLLGPVFAMVLVVAVVALLMVGSRNLATLRGQVEPRYYLTYSGQEPADWIERPARAFNNLLQLPTLLYVACTLMLITHHVDRAQLAYAWLFVALRALHAVVYIAWNPLPYRFGLWLMGLITLLVIWTRFALAAWPGF